jgi:hypothetical protein
MGTIRFVGCLRRQPPIRERVTGLTSVVLCNRSLDDGLPILEPYQGRMVLDPVRLGGEACGALRGVTDCTLRGVRRR